MTLRPRLPRGRRQKVSDQTASDTEVLVNGEAAAALAAAWMCVRVGHEARPRERRGLVLGHRRRLHRPLAHREGHTARRASVGASRAARMAG